MAVDKDSRFLATGDVDGMVKTWDISEHCLKAQDDIVNTMPRKFLIQYYIVYIYCEITA